jgi:hypothetical protein
LGLLAGFEHSAIFTVVSFAADMVSWNTRGSGAAKRTGTAVVADYRNQLGV